MVSLCVIGAAAMGCGAPAGPKKFQVTGKVTLDGQPIQKGYIIFQPVKAGDPPEGAEILDGKYVVRTMPGDKKVEIKASKSTGEKSGKGDEVQENYIPPQYNVKTELTAKVTDKESTNQFDFTLKTKP